MSSTLRLLQGLTLISCAPVLGACDDDSDGDAAQTLSATAGAGGSAAGGTGPAAGRAGSAGASAEPTTRAQDTRTFTYDDSAGEFAALSGVETDRYHGTLDGAGYKIEVPKAWNGILVMYAHGYAGTGAALTVNPPSIRQYLVEHGYAWAASSYSKNYYDVRAGVEDTNKLALAFKRLVSANGRNVDEPKKRYLIGHSMGGHITAAAIEKEAQETAQNKVRYAGAVPMCGVVGDTTLFSYFSAYQYGAEALAGLGPSKTTDGFMAIRMPLRDALYTMYPSATTQAGDKVRTVVENLTGGARPYFALGFGAMQWQDAVWNTFGGDGTVSGILAKPVVDTREIVYQLDADPALSAEEKQLNDKVYRVAPAADANPLQPDGLRFIPVVNGEIDIPVVTIHTLGDLYVPFKMEQVYRQRADAKGHGDKLVQRAIRGTGHCEFTLAEQVSAFEAMVRWEQEGVKPEGDDVLDPAKLSAADYGCRFTQNTFAESELNTVAKARMAGPACP